MFLIEVATMAMIHKLEVGLVWKVALVVCVKVNAQLPKEQFITDHQAHLLIISYGIW
jgi:hypothetical protein